MATGEGTGAPASAGSITAAQVFTTVLNRLRPVGATVISIDEELRSVLYDISTRDDFILKSGTVTGVDGTQSYSLPNDVKHVETVAVNEGNLLDPISFNDYQMKIEDTDSPTEDEPQEYAIRDTTIYFYPIPDTTYTINVYYSIFHPDDIGTIEFGGVFREAIYEGVLALLFKGQLSTVEGAVNHAMNHQQLYEREIDIRRGSLHRNPQYVKYNDI